MEQPETLMPSRLPPDNPDLVEKVEAEKDKILPNNNKKTGHKKKLNRQRNQQRKNCNERLNKLRKELERLKKLEVG